MPYNRAMRLSPLVSKVEPSVTLELNAKAKAMAARGVSVIALAAGEPDFLPPKGAMEAVRRALDEGRCKYTPTPGIPELRQGVAEYLGRFGIKARTAQVVLSTGGKQALHNVIAAVVAPGDEVLLPSPWWVSYPPLVEISGGRCVTVPSPKGAILDVPALEKACTSKTTAIILNSPNNPSGLVVSARELEDLADLCERRNLTVISDELYAELVYSPHRHLSPAALPKLAERTCTVGGFSKCFAMTGWRLGYSVTPEPVARAIEAYQSHITSNANSLAQYAALGALKGSDAEVESMRAVFARRRQLIHKGLNAVRGFSCPEPQGAFYAFPDVTGAMANLGFKDDVALSHHILEKVGVALVPGSAFGAPGHMRLSYAAADAELEEALRRLQRACS